MPRKLVTKAAKKNRILRNESLWDYIRLVMTKEEIKQVAENDLEFKGEEETGAHQVFKLLQVCEIVKPNEERLAVIAYEHFKMDIWGIIGSVSSAEAEERYQKDSQELPNRRIDRRFYPALSVTEYAVSRGIKADHPDDFACGMLCLGAVEIAKAIMHNESIPRV